MDFNYDSKEIRFSIGDEQYKLHPLWMRERSLEEGAVDQNSCLLYTSDAADD